MENRRKGQSTLEYVPLIVIVIAVFISTQQYLKRGFQGRVKATVDDFGEQYDPRLVNSITTYSLISNSDTVVRAVPQTNPITGLPGFFTSRTDNTHSVESKGSSSGVGAFGSNGPQIPEALSQWEANWITP